MTGKRIQVMFLVISMHHKGQGNHWSSQSWFAMRDPKGALQTTQDFYRVQEYPLHISYCFYDQT